MFFCSPKEPKARGFYIIGFEAGLKRVQTNLAGRISHNVPGSRGKRTGTYKRAANRAIYEAYAFLVL